MRRPIARDINQRKRAVGSRVSSWVNFSPLSIPSIEAWYDASDTSTITESGGAVSQWNDKSGNALNVTQGIAASQPTTGSDTQNGLNVLTFNDDRLISARFTRTQPITIFAVVKLTGTLTANRQIIGDDSTTPTLYHLDSWSAYAGGVLSSGIASDGLYHSLTATYNGASSLLLLDQTQVFAGNAGSDGYSNKRILVGASAFGSFWIGNIAEIIVYSKLFTANEFDSVNKYLRNKWGTP